MSLTSGQNDREDRRVDEMTPYGAFLSLLQLGEQLLGPSPLSTFTRADQPSPRACDPALIECGRRRPGVVRTKPHFAQGRAAACQRSPPYRTSRSVGRGRQPTHLVVR